jgi:acyl-CoA hydrolase
VQPQPPSASESVLVRWMGVTDTNNAGFVHGGTVMKLCDEVAGLAAIRHSRVEAERPGSGRVRHTSSAYLTMVALDEDGRPTAVPPLMTEDPTAQRREREAQTRRDNRLAEREELQRHREAETRSTTGAA